MGFIFGDGGRKAARIQAAATMKAAELKAQNDRDMAQAAQQSRETQIAQDRAARAAAEMLSKPMDQVDVTLGPGREKGTLDATTGRRRTPRSAFNSPSRRVGLSI